MTVYTVLTDFALASFLILIGQLIRAKVPFIQKYFIPSSLMAGFLGLFAGQEMLNILPFSDSMGSYTSVLMIVIFAAIGINGFTINKGVLKREAERVVGYGLYKGAQSALQWWLPALVGVLVISKIWPDINYGFGLLLAAGFLGGHGTAAAVGTTMAELGFADAPDLAMTSATVGILAGVFGGLIFIKWATAKGYTQYIKSFAYLSGDLKTGMVSRENQEVMGKDTVSSIALDPLCWHLSLLMVPTGLGYLCSKLVKSYFAVNIPNYACAFILALLFFCVAGGRTDSGIYKYIDKRVNTRISGTCTDYLVFFGVAGIKIPIIVKYAGPLLVLMLLGIFIVWFILRILGPAMNRDSWFERSIFVYGYATGVFAIGFLLLRIVDPENESKTLNDTAFTTPFLTPVETFVWAAGPAMLMGGQHWLFIGIFAAMFFGLIIAAMVMKWWYIKIPLSERKAIVNYSADERDQESAEA
ncbi:sodium/glutamate symporter [Clostridium transplantifaecale]|uniref:sodium/glutamate symporter n=1 Tax=Clostridium transplantifaecale TaxID=2479838 RepID=UPI000F63D141|nr:sodium/glutamate symporter [Clostridium transplantifaecale]